MGRNQMVKLSDCYGTPDWLVQNITSRLGAIQADVCTYRDDDARIHASLRNRTFAQRWWAPSLITPWALPVVADLPTGLIFCNPPYSDTKPWLRLCVEHAQQPWNESIALVLHTPSRLDWHAPDGVYNTAAEMWIPEGRIAFIDPTTGRIAPGNRSDVVLIYWGKRTRELRDGWVDNHGRPGHWVVF